MNPLIRNTAKTFSRRTNGYQSLDRFDELNAEFHGWRNISKLNKNDSHEPQAMILASFSYRRARAKQRQIFLRTYKLTSASRLRRPGSSSPKLKKVVVKLKKVAVSLVSFLRVRSSLSSCNSRSAVSASSPTRLSKFC